MQEQVIWPEAGRYIVAVSGGCDSVTLLHVLSTAAKQHGYRLIVAHFDHGVRPDSAADRQLVEAAAARYGWPFATTEGQLGPAVSENAAREARHRFLERVRHYYDAHSIITAHHQDDLIETSLLNLARGSGRRGIAPMAGGRITRPLLNLSRNQIRAYATEHSLVWHEDSTNQDQSNPRNFLRLSLLPATGAIWRRQYLQIIHDLSDLNTGISQELVQMVNPDGIIPRALLLELSLDELAELIIAQAQALAPGIELDTRLVQELVIFAKTAKPGRHRPLRHDVSIKIMRDGAQIYQSGR